jgi:peptidoglycan/xylan/chitin deacetylase (PgdA/CDA1 family)
VILNPPPWPNGARCAVAFTFDMDADSILHLSHHSTADTRVAAMSALRYGPEIAIPRICGIYKKFNMHQTFFLPAWCIENYPRAVETILDGGHEIGHHHYLHEHANEMSASEERYWFHRSLDVIVETTGQKPKGYRAATYKFSRHTLDILVDAGLDYDASLFGDDIPYILQNDRGSIVELPSHYGLDDWPHYQFSRDFETMMPIKSTQQALQVFKEEFDAAWTYGGLWVAVWHPFLSGRLSRAVAISNLIEHMHKTGDVWFATLGEIAEHIRSLVTRGEWSPRTDKLPYYDGPIPELGNSKPANVQPAGAVERPSKDR